MTDEPYDFAQLGEALATTLVRAAQDQVDKATAMMEQTQELAKILRDQVAAQTKAIEEMTDRFKMCGEQMLEAHRKLNGHDHHAVIGRVDADAVVDELSKRI